MRHPQDYLCAAFGMGDRLKKIHDSGALCPLIIVLIVLLSLVLSVLKFQGKIGNHDSSPIDTAYFSGQYQTSLLLTAIVTIPMALDCVLDAFTLNTSSVADTVTLTARAILIVTMSAPLLLLYSGNFQNDYLNEGYMCMKAFINVSARGCICLLISQVNKGSHNGLICLSAIVFYMVAMHIYLANLHEEVEAANAAVFLFALAYAHYLYLFADWAVTWIWKERKMDSDDVCMIIYCAGLLTLSAGNIVVAEARPRGPMSMSMQNYLYLVFLVIILAFPGQVARFNLRKVLRKMEEREAFIRYISHEIRTPLNTVFLGMSYIKGELIGIAPLVSEYVEPIIDTVNEVNNCCEVALSIVNDLLTFDKLEEGKMALELKETEIHKYVRETIKPFDIQARERSINISFEVNDSDIEWASAHVLRIDQNKMSQVIRNLVSNAIKFTPVDGSIKVSMSRVHFQVAAARRNSYSWGGAPKHPQVDSKVTLSRGLRDFTVKYVDLLKSTYRNSKRIQSLVTSEYCADYFRIEVKDSGAGISEENQQRLFGQYVQFNAGKLQQGNGSGLGLWISKGITELHGGCIGAFSEGEGRGSTFYLELPFFPKGAVMGLDDLSYCRRPSSLSGRRNSDSVDVAFCTHPQGSGYNSNISHADLISLDRKIRSRAGSSEHVYNSEMSESRNMSSRTNGGINPLNDSTPGEDPPRFDSAKSSYRRNLKGVVNFSAIFHRGIVRVGCHSGGNDGEDLESGSRKISGPCLRPREPSESRGDTERKAERKTERKTEPRNTGRSSEGSTESRNTEIRNTETRNTETKFTDMRNIEPRFTLTQRASRVLVVDDSTPTRKLMQRVLSKKGYDVQSAEDGVECVRLIDQSMIEGKGGRGPFDVIIMDDNMPNMSGRDAAKLLREKGYTGMICGVTGNTTPEAEELFIAYGANLVFSKPLDLDLFEREVREYTKQWFPAEAEGSDLITSHAASC